MNDKLRILLRYTLLLECSSSISVISHLAIVATAFKNTVIRQTILPVLKAWSFLRFSNHIYSGQENLRYLCLTRWLANQGWLRWGLGHPKSATNITEPCPALIC